MEHFLEVMKLPYMITVAMSLEKCPTSGQVLPMIDKLEVHLAEKEEDEKFIKDIKLAIRNDLSTQYQDDARREFKERRGYRPRPQVQGFPCCDCGCVGSDNKQNRSCPGPSTGEEGS
ncbi:hypothetical protein CesoFtcFv8_010635 [Champsocephalus esox]|uniref:Uncharacterized protein n=1 Tax=Champsocephalus esox TaxID=159716 RepID=A0AAN8C844_9TELE|nr:hypothetical protein CesoFtcFv8_010635 [Champsocephalus esox]